MCHYNCTLKLFKKNYCRDKGEWDNLPSAERQQREGEFIHVGMIARLAQKTFIQ